MQHLRLLQGRHKGHLRHGPKKQKDSQLQSSQGQLSQGPWPWLPTHLALQQVTGLPLALGRMERQDKTKCWQEWGSTWAAAGHCQGSYLASMSSSLQLPLPETMQGSPCLTEKSPSSLSSFSSFYVLCCSSPVFVCCAVLLLLLCVVLCFVLWTQRLGSFVYLSIEKLI